MIKNFSRLMIAGAAIASLAGSVVIAEAGSALKNTDGVEIKSPGGTALGSATLYIVVNADGTTNRGDGNLSSTRLGVGTYDLRFRRNITPCAFVATIGLSSFSGTELPGEITVVGRVGTTTGVFLQTFNSAGSLADRGFHLFVNC